MEKKKKKLGIKLPYDPAIPLLGTYPEKIIIQKKHTYPNDHCSIICNSLDTNRSMNKENVYIYATEYYSAIKRNETGSFVVMWMNLESVILSEVKSEKRKTNIAYECIYIESRKTVPIRRAGIEMLT